MIIQFPVKPQAPSPVVSSDPEAAEQAPACPTPLIEGQFLYEIFADEAVRVGAPFVPYPEQWKKLPSSTQSLWQASAERFAAAL